MSANAADQTLASLPLPRWAYVPGVDTAADRATLTLVKEQVPPRFEVFVPASHPALLYGLRLNDEGFFWEAHEILEAVWKAAPQGGLDRICLRGCIQIANANLKMKMGRLRAVERLIADAAAEFAELAVRRRGISSGSFAGVFPAVALAERLRSRAGRPEAKGMIVLSAGSQT
jgi:DUF309 family protein family protein